jgi:hypothetical protein
VSDSDVMPAEDGAFSYRIKSQNENHERVAMESELSAHC